MNELSNKEISFLIDFISHFNYIVMTKSAQ